MKAILVVVFALVAMFVFATADPAPETGAEVADNKDTMAAVADSNNQERVKRSPLPEPIPAAGRRAAARRAARRA